MHRYTRPKSEINNILFLLLAAGLLAFIIICRLFQLQVLKHNHYQAIAQASQRGYVELPAQRGEIIIKDHHSQEEFAVATNTTLNLIYADPALIHDPVFITSELGPLLFDLEQAREQDTERIKETYKIAAELTPEELEEQTRPLSDKELQDKFLQDLEQKISAKQRSEILLGNGYTNQTIRQINALNLPGIEALEGAVFAYPQDIKNRQTTAERLASLVEIPSTRLEQILKGENRYVVLKKKLHPDVSEEIQNKIIAEKNRKKESKDDVQRFLGIGMQEEYFRFYPEDTLAANLIGYVNKENQGQYGIERSFDSNLKGKTGKLQTKQDALNRQLTVGDSKIEQAIDGADIVLTIDRSIQLKVERILEDAVKEYIADSGQVVVMDPNTGAIIAMANYPSFNPNSFGDVFKKIEVNFSQEEIESLVETDTEDLFYFYKNPITLDRYLIFREVNENGQQRYYRYENFVGPEAYQNKPVTWPYEPGSVFKTIAMAAAIDAGEVTPNTTYNDVGPVGVDWREDLQRFEFEIKNSEDKYMGLINMTTVLGFSLNTGMTYLSQQMGPALYYNYLERFGFLEPSYIEFTDEIIGKINYFDRWTESELATHTFGQGLTVNMVQLASAYSAVANGGVLMQPHIISEVRYQDGTVSQTEPQQLRKVISKETADQITSMLVTGVEEGVAGNAQVPGHFVAGKTGTSQTYKHGKALSGKGTTITSFAGYAPVNNPKFVILVKLDRPKLVEWGSATAAPTFQEIAAFLLEYYNIPPDKGV